MMKFNSIRWKLPLSYALIALVATLALGAILWASLHEYYSQREQDYMLRHALVASRVVQNLVDADAPIEAIQAQTESLSFLAQSSVRYLNAADEVIADSGPPESRQITLAYNRRNGEPFEEAIPAFVAGSQTFDSFIMLENSETTNVDVTTTTRTFIGPADRMWFSTDTMPGVFAGTTSPPDFMMMATTPFDAGFYQDDAAPLRRTDRIVSIPVHNSAGQILGTVELSQGPAYGSAIVDKVTQVWLLAGIAAIALAGSAGWWISRGITRPLVTLTNATSDMAGGNLAARAPVQRSDELGALAGAFNHMAGRIEETITGLRRFVADAAHELQTPLTALHANLELAITEPDQDKRETFIERAQEQLARLQAMTSGLLELSRIEMNVVREEKQVIDLNQVIEAACELYASRAEQAALAFTCAAASRPIIVYGYESQLRRVVGNLIDNAIKFTPEDGTIQVGARHSGGQAELWVSDTGIGIPPEDLPYLFQRFHRGRNVAAYAGSGLGLAIIKSIVEGHHGQIEVDASPIGTTFRLEIPLYNEPQSEVQDATGQPHFAY